MFNDKKLWKVIFIISISILLGYILLLHILWQNVYLISVNEKAGLGNQMFMYAANFAKSKTSNRHVCRLDSTNNLAKIYPLSVPRCNFFLRYIQDYLLLKKYRYLLDLQSKGKTPLILEPIYLIPEESIETTSFPNIEKFKKNPKMVLLDKDKHGGKRYLRKQNSFLDTFFSDMD